ncbi:cysteine synthase A [Roseomonas elaeocarpi]|uniref:cysteine synthase n=1 Tax=Roseomonas elaeocarpi TaxID=907779 RepID=A0ABV6JSI7_9PROT
MPEQLDPPGSPGPAVQGDGTASPQAAHPDPAGASRIGTPGPHGTAQPPVAARNRLYGSVLDTVGATPLVRLPRLEAEDGLLARVALKLEFFNPLGSVKDRIGLAMVEAAERDGLIAPGRSVLVEPTSGNTGIALAFVAAAKGYRLIVVMPEGASVERRRMIRLMGGEVELTPSARGMGGAIARAEAILASTPGAWMPGQFDNPANPAIHAATTAEEIWIDTAGEVDAVVGGVGTGGSLSGIARTLKPRRPGMRVIGVEPLESAVLSGDEPGPHDIQGIGAGFRPTVLELERVDEILPVSERDALATARRCARVEGLPVGISSGAVLHAMLAVARRPEMRGRLVVGIAASFAERYLSTELFAGL